MAWVKFTKDFNFKPHSQATVAYKAGRVLNVTAACAAEAIRKGKAVRFEKTRKSDEDQGQG